MKALSFETSGHDKPVTRRRIPEAVLSHTAVKPEDTRHFINFASCWASDCRKICNGRIWKHLKGSVYGLFETPRYLPSYRVKKRQTWALTARDLNLALSAYDVALRVSTESSADWICGLHWKVDWPVTITDTWNSDTMKSIWPFAQRKPFVWPVTDTPHIVKEIRTGCVLPLGKLNHRADSLIIKKKQQRRHFWYRSK